MSDRLAIAPLAESDIDSVVTLWLRCGLTRPWNDPHADIALAMRGPNSTVLVGKRAVTGNDSAVAVASVLVGHDGHRGWFYYLCVDPDHQGRGHGRAITAAGEDWLRERGIAKAMLMIRPDNMAVQSFYEALGYSVQPRIVLNRWLDGREPTP